jgi:hypothetical protein
MSTLATSTQHCAGEASQDIEGRKIKKSHPDWRERIKLFLFADNTISKSLI